MSVTAPSELDSSTAGVFSCTVGGYPAPDVTVTKTDLNNEVTVSCHQVHDKQTRSLCVKLRVLLRKHLQTR